MQFSFRMPYRLERGLRFNGYLDFGDISEPSENATIEWVDIDKSRNGWVVPVEKFFSSNISIDLGDARAVISGVQSETLIPQCKEEWLTL